MRHQRFLHVNHRWQNEIKAFDGNKEHKSAPKPLIGDDVFKQMPKLAPI